MTERTLQIVARGERDGQGGYRGCLQIPTRHGSLVVCAQVPPGALEAWRRHAHDVAHPRPGAAAAAPHVEVGIIPLVAAGASWAIAQFGPKLVRGVGRFFGRLFRRGAQRAAQAIRDRIARVARERLARIRREAAARLRAATDPAARQRVLAQVQSQRAALQARVQGALQQVPAQARAAAARAVQRQAPALVAQAGSPLSAHWTAEGLRLALADPQRAAQLTAILGALGTLLQALQVRGPSALSGEDRAALKHAGHYLSARCGELAGIQLAHDVCGYYRGRHRHAVQLADQLAGEC